jgi:hypothetical protein
MEFLNGKILGQFFCLFGAHKSARAYSLRYFIFWKWGVAETSGAFPSAHTHTLVGLFCLKTTALSLTGTVHTSEPLSLSHHYCCCCNNLFVVTGAIM